MYVQEENRLIQLPEISFWISTMQTNYAKTTPAAFRNRSTGDQMEHFTKQKIISGQHHNEYRIFTPSRI